MKRIAILMILCIGFVGFSTKSFAQSSTALKPFAGAKHMYKFSGITNGLDYEFYVTTDPKGTERTGLITNYGTIENDANNDGVATFTELGGVVSGGEVSVNITWDATAATKYGVGGDVQEGVYLFLKVYDESDANICENYRAVKIIPVVNDFSVTLADLGDPSCPDLDFDQGFQPIIVDDEGNNTTAHSNGTSTIQFEVSRVNTTNNWNFTFDIAATNAGNFSYSVNSVTGNQSGTLIDIDAGTITTETVTIEIVFDNQPGQSPEFDITLKTAKDLKTLISPLTLPAVEKHTVKVMPSIGGFTGI